MSGLLLFLLSIVVPPRQCSSSSSSLVCVGCSSSSLVKFNSFECFFLVLGRCGAWQYNTRWARGRSYVRSYVWRGGEQAGGGWVSAHHPCPHHTSHTTLRPPSALLRTRPQLSPVAQLNGSPLAPVAPLWLSQTGPPSPPAPCRLAQEVGLTAASSSYTPDNFAYGSTTFTSWLQVGWHVVGVFVWASLPRAPLHLKLTLAHPIVAPLYTFPP